MQTRCWLESFAILHRDPCLVAIHKPAGLLVHRSPIDTRETRFALQLARDALGQRVYPVHRLDKATSGLLIFALDPDSARQLAGQFARREVAKRYLALVRGWPPAQGCIDRALRHQPDPRADGPRTGEPTSKSALTRFACLGQAVLDRPLGRYPQQRYALLELAPETGRKHQIRRHLNHLNHPVIGDVNHGDRHHNHLFHDWRGYHRLYLAATELHLRHPDSGQALRLSAPLQGDFRATLNALGLAPPPGVEPQSRHSTETGT